MPKTLFAYDYASVRSVDVDGKLHIKVCNISKATVNPYLGSEIPGCRELGLDPDKVYMLLRDPKELEKGAETSNNMQLLSLHDAVNAKDPKKHITIGSTGTDAEFTAPYLRNSLVVWDDEAIKKIESGETQELSCAYRYDPDMTPGKYEGTPYDGVMRNLIFNHVALVKRGRAGPDVVVGDEKPVIVPPSIQLEKQKMNKPLSKKAMVVKGVLQAVLKPLFAADAMPDLNSILAGVKKSNWLEKKPGVLASIKEKMAADADVSALVELLDSLDGAEQNDDDLGVDADPVEEVMAMLRGKLSDEDLAAVEGKIKSMSSAKVAADDPPPFVGKPEVGGEPAVGKPVDMEDKVSKPAMDEAIKEAKKATEVATIKRINGIHEARKVVAPYVGEIAVACDSAEDVYKAALKTMGIETKDVHPSAFKAIVEAQPNPNANKSVTIAKDSSDLDDYYKAFPNARV